MSGFGALHSRHYRGRRQFRRRLHARLALGLRHRLFAARPTMLSQASEVLHFVSIPNNAAIVVLSRSGKSTEIVLLLGKVASSDTKIIDIANTPDSPLALQADVVLKMMATFDHAVSVSMYSVLAMIGALLACATEGRLDK